MISFIQSTFALQKKGMMINCTHTSKPPSSETRDGRDYDGAFHGQDL